MYFNEDKNKNKVFIVFIVIISIFLAYLIILIDNQNKFFFEFTFCILCINCSLFLVYKSFQTLKYISMPFLFWLFFFLFIYLANIGYYFGWIEIIGLNPIYYTKTNNYIIFVLNNLGIMFFSIGLHITNLLTNFNSKKEPQAYIKKNLKDNIKLNYSVFVVIIIVLLATFIYLFSTEIPLFYMFKNIGNTYGVLEVRDQFTQKRDNIMKLYTLYGIALPLTSLLFFIKFLYTRLNLWKYLSFFFIFITFLTLISSTQRWPILNYILIFSILIYNYNNSTKKNKVNIKLFYSILFGLLLFVTFFLTWLKWNSLTIFEVLGSLAYRLLVIQAAMNIFVIKYFPNNADFLYGSGYLQDLSTILPGQQKGTAITVYHLIMGENAFIELGSAPIGVLANGYMNFGLIGALIIITLFGMGLQLIQIAFIRGDKNLSNLVFYCYLSLILALCSQVTIITILLLYAPIIFILYLFFSYKIKIKL